MTTRLSGWSARSAMILYGMNIAQEKAELCILMPGIYIKTSIMMKSLITIGITTAKTRKWLKAGSRLAASGTTLMRMEKW